MKILSLDPAMGVTGWALLTDDASPDGKPEDFGLIRNAEGGDILERVRQFRDELLTLMEKSVPDLIVVETPFARARGGQKVKRSALSLPTYGIAVGTALCAAVGHQSTRHLHGPRPVKVISVPVDTWSIGIRSGGEYKENRVQFATWLYKLREGIFGAKTTAGNVADALLMARWALATRRTDRLTKAL